MTYRADRRGDPTPIDTEISALRPILAPELDENVTSDTEEQIKMLIRQLPLPWGPPADSTTAPNPCSRAAEHPEIPVVCGWQNSSGPAAARGALGRQAVSKSPLVTAVRDQRQPRPNRLFARTRAGPSGDSRTQQTLKPDVSSGTRKAIRYLLGLSCAFGTNADYQGIAEPYPGDIPRSPRTYAVK